MTERTTEWTLERVVAELQKLHASGVTLTYAGMRAAGYGNVITAAERYAGTWPDRRIRPRSQRSAGRSAADVTQRGG